MEDYQGVRGNLSIADKLLVGFKMIAKDLENTLELNKKMSQSTSLLSEV